MVTNRTRSLADYAIVLSDKDNVATALIDMPAGDYTLGAGRSAINVPEGISAGFKLALSDIGNGEQAYKYGYVIGLATQDIEKGSCVHVHNLISAV